MNISSTTPQQQYHLNQSLLSAAESGTVSLLEEALLGGADPLWAPRHNGYTALHLAAMYGHECCCERLIPRSNLNAQDCFGRTALHWASAEGQYACLTLLAPGSNLQMDLSGQSAFYAAIANGHLDCALFFLNLQPIHAPFPNGNGPLHVAASYGQIAILERLLSLFNPLDLNHQGQSAFHLSAQQGHVEALSLLLPVSDVQLQAPHVGTALHFAAAEGYSDCVDLLLPFISPDTLNTEHQTALHLANQNGHIHCLAHLEAFIIQSTTSPNKTLHPAAPSTPTRSL